MEEFFKSYQYTFLALSSIGTLLAVSISLWLANRRYKPKNIHVLVKIESIQNYELDGVCDYIIIDIENLDNIPISLNLDSFKLFQSNHRPADKIPEELPGYLFDNQEPDNHELDPLDSWDPLEKLKKSYPIRINPGWQTKIYLIEKALFKTRLKEVIEKRKFLKFKFNLGIIPKDMIQIVITNQFYINAKISKEARTYIKSLLKESE